MARVLRALRYLDRLPECWRCFSLAENGLDVLLHYLNISKKYPCSIRLKNYVSIEAKNFHDLATCWVIFFRREYPIPLEARTVVDVGANIGVFSVWAASQLPEARIVAVEPFPSIYTRLVENVQKHKLGERVETLAIGVAGQTGNGWMDIDCEVSQSRGLDQKSEDFDRRNERVKVETFSLDKLIAQVCEKWACTKVDLVKMDIEGSEHDVIAQASIETLKKIRSLVLEYHPNQSKVPLFSKLEQAGFQCGLDQQFHPDCGVALFMQPSSF